ncbi:hypothetical protein AZE42_05630 [Rhizopogon vesiculosus]|uniref:Uncharacterized protein n=1 Tax=Rhizopogon vesiculosus TaxID=180088 RepID=A0A1J8QE87_9AGAM|nr:hypothetical protein AZE42_05630 [Rhizopogon vesiculosus]
MQPTKNTINSAEYHIRHGPDKHINVLQDGTFQTSRMNMMKHPDEGELRPTRPVEAVLVVAATHGDDDRDEFFLTSLMGLYEFVPLLTRTHKHICTISTENENNPPVMNPDMLAVFTKAGGAGTDTWNEITSSPRHYLSLESSFPPYSGVKEPLS